jgi:hypothetical protein
MKYLQFTLRDFFWLTIVVGLTVGIVIERNEVRALRMYQQKAQWWEDEAKDFAKEVEKQTGIKTDFQEGAGTNSSGGISMTTGPGTRLWTTSVYVRSTEDKSYSWPTGMLDLNMMLIAAPCLAVVFLISTNPKGALKRQAAAVKMRPYAGLWIVVGVMSVAMAYGGYLSGDPFRATLFLLQGAVCAWNYWRFKHAAPVAAVALPG